MMPILKNKPYYRTKFFAGAINFTPPVKNIVKKSVLNIEQKIENESDKRILQKMHWHKNYLLSCKSNWE